MGHYGSQPLNLLTCTSCSSQVVINIESTIGQKKHQHISLIKDPKLVHLYLEPCFFRSDLLPRLAISAFCALRAFVPPADAPNAALRGSAVAASAAVAAASSALPAGAADEYLNYNMTGGVEMGRNG